MSRRFLFTGFAASEYTPGSQGKPAGGVGRTSASAAKCEAGAYLDKIPETEYEFEHLGEESFRILGS
jgi:hypothetical protein